MILEPNVPKSVRNWAACQVRIRKLEHLIERLSAGHPTTYRQFGALKALGREEFIVQVAGPEVRRLKRQNRRYRLLVRTLKALAEPQKHLLGKREMLELIGNTLHFTEHRADTFLTLQYCSADGESINGKTGNGKRIFCEYHDSDGIDALDLLSFGFGRA